jgi:hypothetical protein
MALVLEAMNTLASVTEEALCSQTMLADVHKCTRVENPGEGLAQSFAKEGDFGLYCIFINKFLEILLGRSYIYLPTVCIYADVGRVLG